jgi:hypothetical protein
VSFDDSGRLVAPDHGQRSPASALAGYLADAVRLAQDRRDDVEDEAGQLEPGFEALRWFLLPQACLG